MYPPAGVVCPVSVGVGNPVNTFECFGSRSPGVLFPVTSKLEADDERRKSFFNGFCFLRLLLVGGGRGFELGRRGSREKTCATAELDIIFGWPGMGIVGRGVGEGGRTRRRRE